MPAVCIRKIYKSDEYQSVVFGFGLQDQTAHLGIRTPAVQT